MATQHMPQIGWAPNKYTLYNASPEPMVLRWAGIQFVLPPSDGIGEKAAEDADGDKIPGTYVLSDSYTVDKDGVIPEKGSVPNWSAYEAIRNLLGVDPVTKEALSPHAKAGVTFFPDKPTKDLIDAMKVDAARRYEEHLVEWADQTVAGYLDAVQKSKDAHVPPPPPSRDYTRARMILERANKRHNVDLEEEQAGPSDEEAEMAAFVHAKAMEMAEKASVGKAIDKSKLAEELLEDPTIRKNLQRKFRIRKIGHLDVPGVPEEA